MIFLEVNGITFNGFTDISVTKSIDTLSGVFSFSATEQDVIQLPFFVGESCKVFIDGDQIMEGFIDLISSNYDSSTHEISIAGRDKTADVIDTTLGALVEFNESISFKDLILRTMEVNGLSGIDVIDNVPGLTPFEKSDIEAGEIGESLFDFFEALARKKQVLLTSDNIGNIIITRSSSESLPDSILNTGSESNIKSGNVSYDSSERFGTYIVRSQDNNAGSSLFGAPVDTDKAYARLGESVDPDIRTSRTLNLIAEKSYNDDECQSRAEWEQNIRRIQSVTYSAKVQGHRTVIDNELWIPNRLVKVNDKFSGINATMLINNVTYSFSNKSGSETDLTFVDKDAYKVQAEKPRKEKKANKTGGLFG